MSKQEHKTTFQYKTAFQDQSHKQNTIMHMHMHVMSTTWSANTACRVVQLPNDGSLYMFATPCVSPGAIPKPLQVSYMGPGESDLGMKEYRLGVPCLQKEGTPELRYLELLWTSSPSVGFLQYRRVLLRAE